MIRARRRAVVAIALLAHSCATEAARVGERLPGSTTSELAEPIDFELSLHRADSDVRAGEWIVEMQSNLAGPSRRRRSRFVLDARVEVQAWLNAEAERTHYRSLRCMVRTGTVSIRANADTPAAIVLELVDAVSVADLYQLDLAVAPGAGEEQMRRLPVPFAVDEWNIPEVLWITAEHVGDNGPLRFGLRESRGLPGANYLELDAWTLREEAGASDPMPVVTPPVSRGSVDGIGSLRDVVRDWRAEKSRSSPSPLQGVVRGESVDLQAMIEVIDAFRAAGIRQVSFERRAPRGERVVY